MEPYLKNPEIVLDLKIVNNALLKYFILIMKQ